MNRNLALLILLIGSVVERSDAVSCYSGYYSSGPIEYVPPFNATRLPTCNGPTCTGSLINNTNSSSYGNYNFALHCIDNTTDQADLCLTSQDRDTQYNATFFVYGQSCCVRRQIGTIVTVYCFCQTDNCNADMPLTTDYSVTQSGKLPTTINNMPPTAINNMPPTTINNMPPTTINNIPQAVSCYNSLTDSTIYSGPFNAAKCNGATCTGSMLNLTDGNLYFVRNCSSDTTNQADQCLALQDQYLKQYNTPSTVFVFGQSCCVRSEISGTVSISCFCQSDNCNADLPPTTDYVPTTISMPSTTIHNMPSTTINNKQPNAINNDQGNAINKMQQTKTQNASSFGPSARPTCISLLATVLIAMAAVL